MNENSSNDRLPEAAVLGDSSVDVENADSAVSTPVEGKKRASAGLIGWLSLMIVVVALAGGGYWYFTKSENGTTENRDAERIASLAAAVQSADRTIAALDVKIDELGGLALARDQRLQAIEGQLSERLQQLESLPGRVGNLEGSMASLRGISSGLRDSWLLAEAEYYMQIGNAQLQLAGNPKLAMIALQLADEKIQQMANPALTDIRRALADEQRSLEAVDSPDIEGIALTLSSLATVADSLPLDIDIEFAQSGDEGNGEVDADLSGMDRVLASLKKTASEVVSVRRSDEAVRPLIAPEAQYFLRANLALQFQAARLALLRGEQTLFDQSLDDAATWLNRYYDTHSEPVLSALKTIGEARQSVMPVSLPDISGSLKLLREYLVLSTARRPAPARAEPAASDSDEDTQ